MKEIIELGVEIFNEKHRVIVMKSAEVKTPRFGGSVHTAMYAASVGDLCHQWWLKHREHNEQQMTVQEWMEYMLLPPITEEFLFDRALRVHHVDLKGHVI